MRVVSRIHSLPEIHNTTLMPNSLTHIKLPSGVHGKLTSLIQGYNYEGYDRIIDFHIKGIRKRWGMRTG
jgi:hypothetical protein